jgi:hypothetical protein
MVARSCASFVPRSPIARSPTQSCRPLASSHPCRECGGTVRARSGPDRRRPSWKSEVDDRIRWSSNFLICVCEPAKPASADTVGRESSVRSNSTGARSASAKCSRTVLTQLIHKDRFELAASAPEAVGDQLGLEGVREALGQRVAVGVVARADRGGHAVIGELLGSSRWRRIRCRARSAAPARRRRWGRARARPSEAGQGRAWCARAVRAASRLRTATTHRR